MEQRVQFKSGEFQGKCWADDGAGSCTNNSVTALGLCEHHLELLRYTSALS